ncbi:hypothetical protein QP028_08665 [Corynebacterium suedekumii]|nr:hypothetical protein QP028_08665 [Corynebacterium suedekumii]
MTTASLPEKELPMLSLALDLSGDIINLVVMIINQITHSIG